MAAAAQLPANALDWVRAIALARARVRVRVSVRVRATVGVRIGVKGSGWVA